MVEQSNSSKASVIAQLETSYSHFVGFFESVCDLEFGSREEWSLNHELMSTTRFTIYKE